MFALPATFLVRWRGWVIAAWAALALLFAPRASHVQQVLALRGGISETTEASRATELLKQAFPSPFADYVAIVVHGPVRWTNQRFRSEEHTSELQSQSNLVCRLLLEKKKKTTTYYWYMAES